MGHPALARIAQPRSRAICGTTASSSHGHADLEACVAGRQRRSARMARRLRRCAGAPRIRASLAVLDLPAVVIDCDIDSGIVSELMKRVDAGLRLIAPEARQTPASCAAPSAPTPAPSARPACPCSSTSRRAPTCCAAVRTPPTRRLPMPDSPRRCSNCARSRKPFRASRRCRTCASAPAPATCTR